MSKSASKGGFKPIHWLMIVGAAAAIFLATGDSSPAKAPAKKKDTVVKKQAKDDLYTKEDLVAKFSAMKEPLKNGFRPIISKTVTTLAGPVGMNKIPNSLTGGENWIYTGSAEMDGEKTALLENTQTGEGVFLKIGEKWKMLSIRAIRPEGLIILASDGTESTIPIADDSTKNATSTVPRITIPNQMVAGGNSPVNPSLNGDINGMGLQPMDTGQGGGGGGGNNGRRRRNRGG